MIVLLIWTPFLFHLELQGFFTVENLRLRFVFLFFLCQISLSP